MSAICDDLFIAYPIVGEVKFRRLDTLSELVRTRVSVESMEGANLLNDHLGRVGRKQDVMVKVETGLERTGVSSTDLEGFLQALSRMRSLHAVGIFTHEGQAYRCGNRQGIEQVYTDVLGRLGRMKEVFIRVFDREPEVSPGCTLTARLVSGDSGFTEIRPGTYVFADTNCVTSGMYADAECALTVLVQVVSVNRNGRVVVDGGSKTFAMDRHSVHGHGMVVGHSDLRFNRLSEEHGVMETDRPEEYRVGDLLEVIPAHVCPVVNLHSTLHVRDGEEIVERWRIDARGCVV